MRVTIEHRETTSGITGQRKDCYIDCTVNFSEEEQAIIKTRDLYGQGFTVRTSTPLPSRSAMAGAGLVRFLGGIMIIVGVVWGIAGGGVPTGLLFFGGLGLTVFGWFKMRKQDQRLETTEQDITVKQLLGRPTFTVHAWNAAAAKGLEETIRDELVRLKNVIADSAQLQARQTFEL